MVGVLGIANGAVAVVFFVLAGLIVLPLVELVLPISTGIGSSKSITRRPSLLVPLVAPTITVVLITKRPRGGSLRPSDWLRIRTRFEILGRLATEGEPAAHHPNTELVDSVGDFQGQRDGTEHAGLD
jgi:hypothetical protein